MQLRCTNVQHSSCAMRCMAAGRDPAGAPSAVRSLRSPSRLFLRRRRHTPTAFWALPKPLRYVRAWSGVARSVPARASRRPFVRALRSVGSRRR